MASKGYYLHDDRVGGYAAPNDEIWEYQDAAGKVYGPYSAAKIYNWKGKYFDGSLVIRPLGCYWTKLAFIEEELDDAARGGPLMQDTLKALSVRSAYMLWDIKLPTGDILENIRGTELLQWYLEDEIFGPGAKVRPVDGYWSSLSLVEEFLRRKFDYGSGTPSARIRPPSPGAKRGRTAQEIVDAARSRSTRDEDYSRADPDRTGPRGRDSRNTGAFFNKRPDDFASASRNYTPPMPTESTPFSDRSKRVRDRDDSVSLTPIVFGSTRRAPSGYDGDRGRGSRGGRADRGSALQDDVLGGEEFGRAYGSGSARRNDRRERRDRGRGDRRGTGRDRRGGAGGTFGEASEASASLASAVAGLQLETRLSTDASGNVVPSHEAKAAAATTTPGNAASGAAAAAVMDLTNSGAFDALLASATAAGNPTSWADITDSPINPPSTTGFDNPLGLSEKPIPKPEVKEPVAEKKAEKAEAAEEQTAPPADKLSEDKPAVDQPPVPQEAPEPKDDDKAVAAAPEPRAEEAASGAAQHEDSHSPKASGEVKDSRPPFKVMDPRETSPAAPEPPQDRTEVLSSAPAPAEDKSDPHSAAVHCAATVETPDLLKAEVPEPVAAPPAPAKVEEAASLAEKEVGGAEVKPAGGGAEKSEGLNVDVSDGAAPPAEPSPNATAVAKVLPEELC